MSGHAELYPWIITENSKCVNWYRFCMDKAIILLISMLKFIQEEKSQLCKTFMYF